jgi:hypothetical protein
VFLFSVLDLDNDGELNEVEIAQAKAIVGSGAFKLQNRAQISKAEFVIYCKDHLDLDDLLAPFEIVPNRRRERDIINEIMDNFTRDGLTDGQTVYLLPYRWWEAWKSYVGFDELQTDISGTGIQGAKPLPINSWHELTHQRKLRSDIVEDIDYKVVPEMVWGHLFAWYKGEPPIKRVAIAINGVV